MSLEAAVSEMVRHNTVEVPPFPEAALKLTQALSRPNWSVEELVAILKTDQMLAATLLRLANSAAYSRGEQVTELSVAVVRIGAQDLNRLSLTSGLQGIAGEAGALASLRRRVWREALGAARICEMLATISGDKSEESYVAGLLHDIGRLLAVASLESVLTTFPQEAARSEADWWRLVESLHVELGEVLASRWRLPELITRVISQHHRTDVELTPVMRRIRVSDAVVALLEESACPDALALRRRTDLGSGECEMLAAQLPSISDFAWAFSPPVPLGSSGSKILRLPSTQPTTAARAFLQIERDEAPPVRCAVRAAAGDSVSVESLQPFEENMLVRVSAVDDPQLVFSAKVESTSPAGANYQVLLTPFAMRRNIYLRWLSFIEKAKSAS